MKEDDFFSELKNKSPDDNEVERTKQIIKIFDISNGEEITRFNMNSDIFLLADVLLKFIKVSTKCYGINPL